ncbi:MAG: hypothetical protein H0X46_03135, partial [Bacteroidetes bacterium]|nr:hypothetical protein [Bacteroidota bacterium]
YMLSGFFVTHVQHFYAVIGAAWLPYIILNYYKMHVTKDYRYAMYAALFLFFNLTGGNHTFTFILSYLFACIGGYFIFIAIREKKKAIVFRLLKLNALFVTLTGLLSTVVFVIFVQVKPYIGRLSGMSYKDASLNPLSPQSLLSLLLPLSTVNGTEIYDTDPSMCNIYIGVILIPFIILSLLRRRTGLESILLVFAIVCLLASFGSYTPIHKILFNYFPFMGLFRFPSYFSLFTIIILLLLGGKQLTSTLSSFTISRDKLLKITGGLMAAVLMLIIFSIIKNNGTSLFFLNDYENIFEFIAAANFYQNIILQGTIQLIMLSLLFLIILKISSDGLRMKVIMLFVVADMIIATQLNIAYLGFSPASPKELNEYVESLPKGFPVPAMNNISENTEEAGQKHGLYRNTSVFHKRISADVFNSFCFKNQVMMLDSLRPLYDSMLRNPLVYISKDVFSETAFKNKQVTITPKTIILSDEDYLSIAQRLKDTSRLQYDVGITNYKTDYVTASVKTSSAALFTLLQNQYTGWKAFVNGQEKEILLSNYLTMSVLVPQGENVVEFKYENKPVVIGGIISYSVFILLLIVITIMWIREKKNYLAIVTIWLILATSAAYYFL